LHHKFIEFNGCFEAIFPCSQLENKYVIATWFADDISDIIDEISDRVAGSRDMYPFTFDNLIQLWENIEDNGSC
jgi:hypothetical protein